MNFTGTLPNSNILVKLRVLNDTIKLDSVGELWIDRVFQEMEHTDIVADVIQVCDKVYGRNQDMEIVERPQELMVGDTVYLFYLGVQNAIKRWRQKVLVHNPDGRMIVDGKDIYLILNFPNNVFMAVRDGVPIPVNDYVIIEPTYKELREMESKAKQGGIEVPQSMVEKWKEKTQWGIVRYTGRILSPNKEKFYESIVPGVEVMIRENSDIPLEYAYHQTFERGKKLCRVKRSDVVYISETE